MSDKEIISSLECCYGFHCERCPLKADIHCRQKLLNESIELIKHQQAEIDKLERKIKEQNEIIANSNFAEFYIHKHSIENIEGYTADIYKRAIKEFADKLVQKTSVIGFNATSEDYIDGYFAAVNYYDAKISNLVKEVAGDGDG